MFEIKKHLRWAELKVGLIIFSALIILVITVLFAGSIEELFAPKVEIIAYIKDIKGLREGDPVWLAGIEIGSVKKISLDPIHGTEILLSIKKDALPFLKKDTHAMVLTQGLLGDKFVELSPGSQFSPQLKEHDIIRGEIVTELQDIVDESSVSLKNVSRFFQRLEEILKKIEKGEGTLSRLINDPSLFNNLKDSTTELHKAISDLKKAKGTIGKLIYDETIYRELKESLNALKDFTNTLGEGKGTIRYLIDDPSLYNNMNEASIKIKNILENIESGKGVAGDLLTELELRDDTEPELRDDLGETLSELKELIKDIKTNPKRYFKFSLF